ncbi:hypothetical protein [Paenibacillus sp. IITD108]|uniref:hypothetical protein n=1 Tax=Paenibacillus sp. IITD108 TaxID=3116649 RepID=UPI002F41A1AF
MKAEFKRISQSTIDKAREVEILFVAEALGDEITRSGRSYFTYQTEGESTPSVAITPSKGIWHNFGGTEGGSCAISYYAYRNNITLEGKDFIDSVKGVCHLAGINIEYEDGSIEAAERSGQENVFRNKVIDEDESIPKEVPERVDYVYREWMKQLSLIDIHDDHLKSVRKLNYSQIHSREYRSLLESKRDRYRVVRDILPFVGEPIGIPGFALCQGKYGPYWTTLGREGLLIPYRDISNFMQGFQIRFDKPNKVVKRVGKIKVKESQQFLAVLDSNTGEILWEGSRNELPIELPEGKVSLVDGNSYYWFASLTLKKKGILAGTLIGEPVPYHCAVPSKKLRSWKPGVSIKDMMDTSTIWWGEGALKGDIASDFTDQLHLQAPGVNSWRILLEPTLALKPKRVILGFDADAQTKEGVQENVLNCIEEAKKVFMSHNIELLIAIWPIKLGKGIDDLFNNGYKPQIIAISDSMNETTI